jgi:LacI family transcriptional regulator
MTDRSRPPTITEVAIAAGVDRSSVSRAFSRPELLRPETVEAIRAVAARLGYAPNRNARALSTGRHGNIALIVPDIADPLFPPLVRAAQLEADRAGLCVFLGNSDENPQFEERLIAQLLGQVDGVLLAFPRLSNGAVQRLAQQKRVVVIGRDVPGVPRVLVDTSPGLEEAVRNLAENGHRRLAYVGGPPTSWANKLRRSALMSIAARAELALTTIPATGAGYDTGVAAARTLKGSGITGVLTFDDVVGQGVIAGLNAHGQKVPADVSVISCEQVPGIRGEPPLTTIPARLADAGKIALSLLVDAFDTEGLTDARYVLAAHLVAGGTTGPVAGA